MTKADLVEQISNNTGLTKKDTAEAVDEFLNQPTRDCSFRRNLRQVARLKPLCVRYFLRLTDNIATVVFGVETEHERVRKRPALRTEIPQVAELEANFFEDFAVHGLLDALARFDKSRQGAVHAGWPSRVARAGGRL